MKTFLKSQNTNKIPKGVLFVFLLVPLVAFSQSSSSNYQVQYDSVNVGGAQSSSSNFGSEDSLGESATGVSSSSNFGIEAGFQRLGHTVVYLSDAGNVSMSPNLGLSENTSVGSVTWNVITDSSTGYQLLVKTSSNPAMIDTGNPSNTFDDYSENTPGTPETWSVDSNTIQFGFSAVGVDVLNDYDSDSETSCESSGGLGGSSLKYEGLSLTNVNIAQGSGSTGALGSDTTICFAAEQDGVFAAPGNYQAQITGTVIAI